MVKEDIRKVRRRPGDPDLTRRPRLGGGLKPPWGGVPPPNVFGVWTVAIRKGVWENKALRFDFSCRRLYGFCSRLCPRQVLGFSALSSASSWIFLAKLAEDLTKNNRNQVSSPPSKSSRKHAQSKPRSSKNHPKIPENRALTPPKSMPKRFKTMF